MTQRDLPLLSQFSLNQGVNFAGDDATSSTDSPPPQLRPGNAVETVQWGGTLPSGRRAVVGGLTGLTIGAQ